MPRPARPEDLYRLRIPFDPRLSPDGRMVAFTVKTTAPGKDAYRTAIWATPADGSGDARRLTIGARNDSQARFSPDGTTLAFLSDRRLFAEDEPDRPKDPTDRDDCYQIHLLPLHGGEAHRLTDLPRGVEAFSWSPDGRTIAVLTFSVGATMDEETRRRGRPPKPAPGGTQRSDFRYIDRLDYMANGTGFVDDHIAHLWLVDAATGAARPLVVGRTSVEIAGLVARRDQDRVHGQPRPAPGRRIPIWDPCGRCRHRGRHHHRRWPQPAVPGAGVAARRVGAGRARRPVPARRVPDRDLAVRRRRLGCRWERRRGPARDERAQARCRDEQRRRAG